MPNAIELISLIIAGGVPLVTAIYLYGRLSKQVDMEQKSKDESNGRQEREVEGLKAALILLETKIETKKLDKEVFDQFARRIDESADRNDKDHQAICNKLDQITTILIGQK